MGNNEWVSTTLGELVDTFGGSVQTGPFGSQLHAADYVSEGIPSVMPKNIRIEEIDVEDIARISLSDAERLKKYLLAEGDIVYSRRGDVEKCALVTKNETNWLCGTGCLRIRIPKNKSITPYFLHALLSTPVTREWVSRHAIGATMPNLNTSILRDVPIVVPPFDSMNFIGAMWIKL
ncbi:restriction endonuclease subunit S, partial [Klebsiella quasipneumoniae]